MRSFMQQQVPTVVVAGLIDQPQLAVLTVTVDKFGVFLRQESEGGKLGAVAHQKGLHSPAAHTLVGDPKILGPLTDRGIKDVAQSVDRVSRWQIGVESQMPTIDTANANLRGAALIDLAHARVRHHVKTTSQRYQEKTSSDSQQRPSRFA